MYVHAIACIWIHVVPVDEPGAKLYICTNNIYMHTHWLPRRAINKHLWKLNSCTRHEQWKLTLIYLFRSWHWTYFKDTNGALYIYANFWWHSLQPLAKWGSVLRPANVYNDTQAAESLHLLEYICTVDDLLHSSFIVVRVLHAQFIHHCL